MNNGFNITCKKCEEKVALNVLFKKEHDESKITFSIMGSYPFHSLYLVCSNCKNEIEVEA